MIKYHSKIPERKLDKRSKYIWLKTFILLLFITSLGKAKDLIFYDFNVSSIYSIAQAENQVDEQRVFILGNLNTTPKVISQQNLSKIFSGRKRTWETSHLVQLILLPESSKEMKWLCSQVLKMPETLMRRFLYQRVYRGTISSPQEVLSSDEALNLLKVTQGGIAPVLMNVKDAQIGLLATQGLQIITIE